MLMLSAVETGQMSAAETRQMSTIATGRCPVLLLYICPVSTADISISIDHSASAFRINNQHIMEAATAADLTLRYLVGYITLGSRVMISKGYVSDLTVQLYDHLKLHNHSTTC